MFDKVIGEDKKVVFSSKVYRTDKTNKVGIDKLIYAFNLFFKFTIVDLCGFYSLTTIVNSLFWHIYKVNIKVLQVLSEYLELQLS